MPELRQNFFTKEWVIIATDRAARRNGAGVQWTDFEILP